MNDVTTQQRLIPYTRVTKTRCLPLCRTAIVIGLLLSIMPFLTGCGGGDGDPGLGTAGATVTLAWQPVDDPSISAYFVHYGRQSSGQPGSCEYESFISVDSAAASITNLELNTQYYFAVSAYNGAESACSNEVSIVTPPFIETDPRSPSPFTETPGTTRG